MAEVIVTLTDLIIKDVTARGELTKVYEVKGSDGRKYTTFKRPLAEKAAPLKGQVVVIDYTEVQKGDYTNYYLNDINASSQEPTGSTLEAQTLVSGGITTAAEAAALGVYKAPDANAKDVNIARAVALKAAVETFATGAFEISTAAGIIDVATVYTAWLLSGQIAPHPQGLFSDLGPSSDDPVNAKGELVTF